MNPNMNPTMESPMSHADSEHVQMTWTCKDILHKFQTHDCDDEMRVSNKYLDYAVVLEREGKDCLARRVFEMAYEEYTHAKFQLMVLDDAGCTVSDELRCMFSNLEQRIETLFRQS